MPASARNTTLLYRLGITSWLHRWLLLAYVRRHPWLGVSRIILLLIIIFGSAYFATYQQAEIGPASPVFRQAFSTWLWALFFLAGMDASACRIAESGIRGGFDSTHLWSMPLSPWHAFSILLYDCLIRVLPVSITTLIPVVVVMSNGSTLLWLVLLSVIYIVFLAFWQLFTEAEVAIATARNSCSRSIVFLLLLLIVALWMIAKAWLLHQAHYATITSPLAHRLSYIADVYTGNISLVAHYTPPGLVTETFLSFFAGAYALAAFWLSILVLEIGALSVLTYRFVRTMYCECYPSFPFKPIVHSTPERLPHHLDDLSAYPSSSFSFPRLIRNPQLRELTDIMTPRVHKPGCIWLAVGACLAASGICGILAREPASQLDVILAYMLIPLFAALITAVVHAFILDLGGHTETVVLTPVPRGKFLLSLSFVSLPIMIIILWIIILGFGLWLRLSLPWILLTLFAASCFTIISAPNGWLTTLASGSFTIMRRRGHMIRTLGPSHWRRILSIIVLLAVQLALVPLCVALGYFAFNEQAHLGPALIALGFSALYTVFYFYGMTAYCGWLLQKKEMFICEKFLYRRD